jgi:hypothetical protein
VAAAQEKRLRAAMEDARAVQTKQAAMIAERDEQLAALRGQLSSAGSDTATLRRDLDERQQRTVQLQVSSRAVRGKGGYSGG